MRMRRSLVDHVTYRNNPLFRCVLLALLFDGMWLDKGQNIISLLLLRIEDRDDVPNIKTATPCLPAPPNTLVVKPSRVVEWQNLLALTTWTFQLNVTSASSSNPTMRYVTCPCMPAPMCVDLKDHITLSPANMYGGGGDSGLSCLPWSSCGELGSSWSSSLVWLRMTTVSSRAAIVETVYDTATMF